MTGGGGNTTRILGFLRRHAAMLAFVVAAAVAVVGSLAFFLALRPCAVDLAPGERVGWFLEQTLTEIDDAGRPLPDQEPQHLGGNLDLICLGPGNEALLRVPGEAGRAPRLHQVRLQRNGRVRRLDDAGRALDDGLAIGFFDLNLLPLPPGNEQQWSERLPYACLPPGQREVAVTVHRLRNGYRPEFVIELPLITWLEDQPGARPGRQRYVQLRTLRCDYRFNPVYGVVDQAEFNCLLEIEVPDGIRRHQVSARLELRERRMPDHAAAGNIGLARAILRLQRDLESGRRPAAADVAIVVDGPVRDGPFREHMLALLGRQPVAAAGSWAVRVASTGADHRDQAEELRRSLVTDGYPAFIVERDGRLLVHAGPYAAQDGRILAALTERFRRERPHWVELRP
jgi:hypothetical protein